MKIFLDNPKYEYEISMLIKSFTKIDVDFKNIDEFDENIEGDFLLIFQEESDEPEYTEIIGLSNIAGKILEYSEEVPNQNSEIKNAYKRFIYEAFSDMLNKQLPWGILTGIRPIKIYNDYLNRKDRLSDEEIETDINTKFYISKEKIKLMSLIANLQQKLFEKTLKNSYSIYIGIPFCPTRCNYCSFFSNDLVSKGHLREDFLQALFIEIEQTLKSKWFADKTVDSIYIGGGTPTSLDEKQMIHLLTFLDSKFNFKNQREITFEAGRPDTITEKKLKIIKSFGINRISINPQTMVDSTLEKIGRNHTSQDVINSVEMAQKIGFDNINMDIILGLESENLENVKYTLNRLLDLNPDSLTMHTLSIKKAAKLAQEVDIEELEKQDRSISTMIDEVYNFANQLEMSPYYLYRQKNILGGYENIGFAKKDKESWYNIAIMEEVQNIIAFGPGSVSRFIYPEENRIERVSNVKNLEMYIKDIHLSVEKKLLEMK